jgi:hypothetical protein
MAVTSSLSGNWTMSLSGNWTMSLSGTLFSWPVSWSARYYGSHSSGRYAGAACRTAKESRIHRISWHPVTLSLPLRNG